MRRAAAALVETIGGLALVLGAFVVTAAPVVLLGLLGIDDPVALIGLGLLLVLVVWVIGGIAVETFEWRARRRRR